MKKYMLLFTCTAFLLFTNDAFAAGVTKKSYAQDCVSQGAPKKYCECMAGAIDNTMGLIRLHSVA